MTATPIPPPPPPPAATAGGRRPERGGVVILNWRDTRNPEGGGSELFVERVAAGLVAQGRPVTIVCAAWPGAPREEWRHGVRILRRGGRLGVYLGAFLLYATGRLGPHDVVVDVQNGLPFFSVLYARAPVVVLVHHVHREQWRVVLPALPARFGWWVESRLAPRVYRGGSYVAVSESTRQELAGLGVGPASIAIVHNGTDPPAVDNGTDPPAVDEDLAGRPRTPYPSVCVLGRLVPHKRVELALEAAARIRGRLPGLKVSVAGQGWWEPRLREAVARLGLEDTVELLGFVDEQAKHDLLARSWVLAMPSIKEGWGQAVIEAAGHATPTVAFRSAGGLAESVVDGRTGLLADDLDEFAGHLERMLSDPSLRQRLGAAARERAAGFTWPQATAAFAGVLDGVVSAASAAARVGAQATADPAVASQGGQART
jgi:glycosyltransferase involved in cell wall biosynthesis